MARTPIRRILKTTPADKPAPQPEPEPQLDHEERAGPASTEPAPALSSESAPEPEQAEHRPTMPPPPEARALPFRMPTPRADHARIIESIFESRIDVVGEFAELERDLVIEEALSPQVIDGRLATVERQAMRAHRLFIVAKADLEAFRVDAEVALGAMRDHATGELTKEKKSGDRTKQITDADVRERAAALYPDEWRDLNERLTRFELYAKNLEFFADRWKQRAYTLTAMKGGR